MKITKIFLTIGLSLSFSGHATVDVQDRVTIVSQNIHDEGYITQTVPAEYCVGIGSLALAKAITRPVLIQDNYGCGQENENTKNVNAGSCAVLHAEEVERNGQYIGNEVNLKIDTSNCEDQANPAFQLALKKAILATYKNSKIKVNFTK
jgi:hypothetical protein